MPKQSYIVNCKECSILFITTDEKQEICYLCEWQRTLKECGSYSDTDILQAVKFIEDKLDPVNR